MRSQSPSRTRGTQQQQQQRWRHLIQLQQAMTRGTQQQQQRRRRFNVILGHLPARDLIAAGYGGVVLEESSSSSRSSIHNDDDDNNNNNNDKPSSILSFEETRAEKNINNNKSNRDRTIQQFCQVLGIDKIVQQINDELESPLSPSPTAATTTTTTTDINNNNNNDNKIADQQISMILSRYMPTTAYGAACLGSFLATVAVIPVIHKYSDKLSTRYSETYRKLNEGEKLEWNANVVSTLHATVSAIASIYTLRNLKGKKIDPFTFHSKRLGALLSMTVGYFVSDLMILLIQRNGGQNKTNKDIKTFILHHLIGILGIYPHLKERSCLYYGSLWMLTELSTPFVNLRWFLSKCGYKNSPVYIANGLTMVGLFFLVRIMFLPYAFYKSVLLNPKNRAKLLTHKRDLVFVLLAFSAIINMMNAKWFYLMIRALTSVLNGSSSSSNNNNNNSDSLNK